RWQGEDVRGKTVLLTAEQGVGDALQFIRFAEPLAARGAHVLVQAHAELCDLLTTAPGVATALAAGQSLPACDFELPLLSLPYRLGITPADVAVRNRYLHSDASKRPPFAADPSLRHARTHNIGVA